MVDEPSQGSELDILDLVKELVTQAEARNERLSELSSQLAAQQEQLNRIEDKSDKTHALVAGNGDETSMFAQLLIARKEIADLQEENKSLKTDVAQVKEWRNKTTAYVLVFVILWGVATVVLPIVLP